MTATDEQKAILHVLLLLGKQGNDWLRTLPIKAFNSNRVATQQFTPIKETELETMFLYRGKVGRFSDDLALYVLPPEKEPSAVAAIWCRWNFCRATPKCGFYYGTWSDQKKLPCTESEEMQKQTVFVGYRYETPEQGDNHNFYHAQPCQSMGPRDVPIHYTLPISSRHPTWPLAAESALELLLCLVISLYGMNGLRKMKSFFENHTITRNNQKLRAAFDKLFRLQNEGG